MTTGMLWFLRGIGAVCAALTAWIALHSLKEQLAKKKRAWTFVHAVAATAVAAYVVSELALGWMYLSRPTRIFCVSCWVLLSLCCILSVILDTIRIFRKPEDESFRRFSRDIDTLLIAGVLAILPLLPAYLYIVL